MRRTRLVLLLLHCLLLLLPAAQLVFGVLPPLQLQGVERAAERPSLTVKGCWDGSFQKNTSAWFSSTLGLRAYLVRTDNSLNLTLFGDLSSQSEARLILGAGGQLFERNYVDDINRANWLATPALEERARSLAELQALLGARGITLFVVISPNKAAFHADAVPLRYRRLDRTQLERNTTRFVPALVSEGVNHLNTSAFLAGEGRVPGRPNFPRSGTHWTSLTAFRVAQKLLRELERESGRDLVDLEATGDTAQAQPLGMDADLAELTNVWDPERFYDARYFYPVWEPRAGDALPKPRLLIVGGSFTQGYLGYLQHAQVFPSTEFFWYYRRRISADGVTRALDPTALDWEQDVFSADIIVVEVNEADVANVGQGFVEDALERLR